MLSSGRSGRLEAARTLRVPESAVAGTVDALRDFGSRGFEALILWVGDIVDDMAIVRSFIVPPQRPIQGEDAVGYFVTAETLLALNHLLSEKKLRLLAQVHSHPGAAYHSDTDDRYAIVTAEGGYSLVVPDFGGGPVSMSAWAVYRLRDSRWTELTETEAAEQIVVGDLASSAR